MWKVAALLGLILAGCAYTPPAVVDTDPVAEVPSVALTVDGDAVSASITLNADLASFSWQMGVPDESEVDPLSVQVPEGWTCQTWPSLFNTADGLMTGFEASCEGPQQAVGTLELGGVTFSAGDVMVSFTNLTVYDEFGSLVVGCDLAAETGCHLPPALHLAIAPPVATETAVPGPTPD